METLVEDVLDYTRVIGQEFDSSRTDLNLLLREVLCNEKTLIDERDACIEIADLPVIMADKAQLLIYFQKLIENALTFCKTDIRPQISIFSKEKPGRGTVDITVKDNGIGIHASKHQQVFQIFKKLNSPMDHGGSGLGLAICRRIALNHGSKVSLVSAPDAGAAFSIELDRLD